MARSVLLVAIGALLGGAGTCLMSLPAPAPGTSMSAAVTAEGGARAGLQPATNHAQAGVSASGVTAARLDVYERAMQAADAIDLEARLDSAAAAPRSRSRDLAISVLLARLAELEPYRAVEYASAARLDTEFLVQAYVAVARVDAELALSDLRFITPAALQRRIAIALLDVLDNDEPGVERIAQALPANRRMSFELDALLSRAEADPASTLASAFEYDRPTLGSYLLPRLAEIAARRDPLGALAFSESIADYSFRSTFQNALFTAWADVEPASVFEWLEAADTSIHSVSSVAAGAFPALANADPERLLAMVDDLAPSWRLNAYGAVITTYAERNPETAIAMVEAIPMGRDRDSFLQTIAEAYGRRNPGLALDWARALTPPSPWTVQAVLRGMAEVDADRAVDAFFTELERSGAGASVSPSSAAQALSLPRLMSALASSGADMVRLTGRLLESNDRNVRSMLSTTLSSWVSHDIDAALDWTLAHADDLDPSMLRDVARQLGATNFDLAVSTLNRLPTAQRAAWFEQLVDQKLATSADAALSFLGEHRGQPGHGAALGYVAQRMAQTDPARAARIMTESGSSEAMQRSRMVAAQWAGSDPAAAARWALEDIADAEARTTALNSVASVWARRDSVAAERWLFDLESGGNRDAAADGLLLAFAQAGRFEPHILEAYSSGSARQQAAIRAIVTIGLTHPVRARELIDTHLTDPAARARAEESIARSSALRSGTLLR